MTDKQTGDQTDATALPEGIPPQERRLTEKLLARLEQNPSVTAGIVSALMGREIPLHNLRKLKSPEKHQITEWCADADMWARRTLAAIVAVSDEADAIELRLALSSYRREAELLDGALARPESVVQRIAELRAIEERMAPFIARLGLAKPIARPVIDLVRKF